MHHIIIMEAERCNLPHDAHFRMRMASSACGRTLSACGEPSPHAGERFPRAETNLRMQRYLLGVRRRTSACGDTLLGVRRRTSACGGALLGVRRPCSACGDSVFTCGDLFSKLSQPSRFITPLVLIVASILACLISWEASSVSTVTSTRLPRWPWGKAPREGCG